MAPIPVMTITIKAQIRSQTDNIRECGMLGTFKKLVLIIYNMEQKLPDDDLKDDQS
ncbi:MAG: hypothetical protein PHX61_11335 [Alphaproteobacteria bacterium]|nr:hypothetical protein [Alphaproteobacteria bacterium]